MAITSHVRKTLIICGVLAILSQLSILPAFCENRKPPFMNKQHFTSTFTGSVTAVKLDFKDKLLICSLETVGGATVLSMPATVTITEKIILRSDYSGFSIGRFTVTTPAGNIYVSFIAKVWDLVCFKGQFLIDGGTGNFAKVRGYGTIEGYALLPKLELGVGVIGTVDGYLISNK